METLPKRLPIKMKEIGKSIGTDIKLKKHICEMIQTTWVTSY